MRLYEQEKLVIESEVSKLRASPINERDSPYDMMRSSTMLSDTTQQLEIVQSRVRKLEAFIVEQVRMIGSKETPSSVLSVVIFLILRLYH